jgi:uncharacterized membrane protein YhiD involved in acid resistance
MDMTPTSVVITHWEEMAIRLCAAFVGGLLVTAIYRGTRPAGHVSPSFPPTLVLLAIVIAMVTQVIGESLARAFGLVGALSIVRFRTVVRDTQDTAFVIFAVVVGMAAGAGTYIPAAFGLLMVGLAAVVMRPKDDLGWADTESSLNLRVGLGVDAKTLLAPVFEKSVANHEVISVATVRQGAALDYVYRIRLNQGAHPDAFVKELNQLDGVQSVDLRRGEADAP